MKNVVRANSCHGFNFVIVTNSILLFYLVSILLPWPSVATAGPEKWFCFSPSKLTDKPDTITDRCGRQETGNGTRMFVMQVTYSSEDYGCHGYQINAQEHDVTDDQAQAVRNACNGRRICHLEDYASILKVSTIREYFVRYTCMVVKTGDTKSDEFAMSMRNSGSEVVDAEKWLILEMRVSQENAVSRICDVTASEDGEFDVEYLHVDLKGLQGKDCVGRLDLSFDNGQSFHHNCSYSEWKLEHRTEKAEKATTLKLRVIMKDGFVWLKIKGPDRLEVKCALEKNKDKTSVTEPGQGDNTGNRHTPVIQPVPGTTFRTTRKEKITSTITTATTNSTTGNKTTPDSGHKIDTKVITIVIAVVSSIAVIATTLAIVLIIYLCKTRNSPYQRWKSRRRAVQSQIENSSARTAQEYAYVVDTEMTTNQSLSTLNDTYTLPRDSYVTVRPPPPPSPRSSPMGLPQVNGMLYSEVTMTGVDMAGTKIYAPGFYHTNRDHVMDQKEEEGGNTYDALGANGDQYSHLRDVKDNQLRDHPYDG